MIYIFVPFFSVTDCDQNYMQMINLKKLPEYFKSFKIFVIVPGVVLYSFFKKRFFKVYTRFQTKTPLPKNFRLRDFWGVVKFGKYFWGWLDLSGNSNNLQIPDSAHKSRPLVLQIKVQQANLLSFLENF